VPATGEATEGRAEAAAPDEIGLVYRAWQTRVAAIAPAPTAPGAGVGRLTGPRVIFASYQVAQAGRDVAAGKRELPWFDPSGGTASPGNTGRQRLSQSGRKAGEGGDDPIARARKATRFVSTGSSVAWRLGTGAGTPWGIPSLGVGKILDFNFDTWSRCSNALAGDPPRDDFNLLATAEVPALAPVEEGAGASPAVAQAMNAFLGAAYHLTAQLRAAAISRDRMGGALRAGSDEWGARQATAVVGAQRQAGQAMLVVADRLEVLLQALDEAGVDDFDVSEDGVTAYYGELRATGFRPDELQAAHSLGLTDAEIQESLNDRLSFPASEMSGSLRGGAAEAAAALRELGQRLVRLPAPAGG
jgi:hypothetical protein